MSQYHHQQPDGHSQELEAIYTTDSSRNRSEAAGGLDSPPHTLNAAKNGHALSGSSHSSGGASAVHGHTASGVGVSLMPSTSSMTSPTLVEGDTSEDPYFMGVPTVGTGMEEVGLDVEAQAKRRAMAFSSSEVQRKVLVLVDEGDADSSSEPQQVELFKLFSHWFQAYGPSLNISVKLFTYVQPRSNWRYLMLQSPSTARGAACQKYGEACQKLKLKIESALATGTLFAAGNTNVTAAGPLTAGGAAKKMQPTVTVEVHVDSETNTVAAATKQIVKSYRPTLVLMSDRKDQKSLHRHIASTSQEVLIQQLVSELKTIVCVAKPVHIAKSADTQQSFVYDAARSQPRTFVCCVNTQAMFGHLPISIASAASIASPGDRLVIFSAYNVSGDAAAAVYTPNTDWTDRIRGEMDATKDTVARLVTNVSRSFAHLKLKVTSFISDDPFETGLMKYVHQLAPDGKKGGKGDTTADHNVMVVIGAGKLKDYFGSGVVHAWKGDQSDRVRRQLPNVTLLVTPPSKAGF